MTNEQRPHFAYTVTADGDVSSTMATGDAPIGAFETLLWSKVPPAEASALLTLADLDALIDAVRSTAGQELGPDYLFLVTPRTYQRLVYIQRRAYKRRWQDSQKERAQVKRRRRMQKKQAAALFYRYQPKQGL